MRYRAITYRTELLSTVQSRGRTGRSGGGPAPPLIIAGPAGGRVSGVFTWGRAALSSCSFYTSNADTIGHSQMAGHTNTGHHGLVRRIYRVVRFPPPIGERLFSTRAQAASYLGAWALTGAHLVLWLLIAVGVLSSETLLIGVSLMSLAATCMFIGMVITVHRRLALYHGHATRHLITVFWRGPWDPVGRLIWLPVQLPAAWHALRHGTGEPPRPGPGR